MSFQKKLMLGFQEKQKRIDESEGEGELKQTLLEGVEDLSEEGDEGVEDFEVVPYGDLGPGDTYYELEDFGLSHSSEDALDEDDEEDEEDSDEDALEEDEDALEEDEEDSDEEDSDEEDSDEEDSDEEGSDEEDSDEDALDEDVLTDDEESAEDILRALDEEYEGDWDDILDEASLWLDSISYDELYSLVNEAKSVRGKALVPEIMKMWSATGKYKNRKKHNPLKYQKDGRVPRNRGKRNKVKGGHAYKTPKAAASALAAWIGQRRKPGSIKNPATGRTQKRSDGKKYFGFAAKKPHSKLAHWDEDTKYKKGAKKKPKKATRKVVRAAGKKKKAAAKKKAPAKRKKKAMGTSGSVKKAMSKKK